MRINKRHLLSLATVFAACAIAGCSSNDSTTQPLSFSARQDAALKDPMGYKVPPTPDVTDGNMGSVDKPGLRRDMDDVLNP
jgi:hypothetical protein